MDTAPDMKTFGTYEVISQLKDWSSGCERYLARNLEASEYRNVILNVLNLESLSVVYAEQVHDQLTAIQKLASRSRHFVPILELHRDEKQLIWVEPHHELPTLNQKLDLQWSEKQLHAFVADLATALDDYYGISSAAHGNLNCHTILLRRTEPKESKGSSTRFYPILTGFSFLEDSASDKAYLDDLHAIGRMILGIVLRENMDNEPIQFPLRPHPFWEALGQKSHFWKQLASWLLYPDLSLEQLNIPRLRQDLRPRKRYPLVSAASWAAAILVAAWLLPPAIERHFFKPAVSVLDPAPDNAAGDDDDISELERIGSGRSNPVVDASATEPDPSASGSGSRSVAGSVTADSSTAPDMAGMPEGPEALTTAKTAGVDANPGTATEKQDSPEKPIESSVAAVTVPDPLTPDAGGMEDELTGGTDDIAASQDRSDLPPGEVVLITDVGESDSVESPPDEVMTTDTNSMAGVVEQSPAGASVEPGTADDSPTGTSTDIPESEQPRKPEKPSTVITLNPDSLMELPDGDDFDFPDGETVEMAASVPRTMPGPEPEPEMSVPVSTGVVIPEPDPVRSFPAVSSDLPPSPPSTPAADRPVAAEAEPAAQPPAPVQVATVRTTSDPLAAPADGDIWVLPFEEFPMEFIYVADLPGNHVPPGSREFSSGFATASRGAFNSPGAGFNPYEARSRSMSELFGPGRSMQRNRRPQRSIPDTTGGFISRSEIPQNVFQYYHGDNPSIEHGNELPVNSISWTEANAFCNRLNDALASTLQGRWQFTLPTSQQFYFLAGVSDEDGGDFLKNNFQQMADSEIVSLKERFKAPSPVSDGQPFSRFGFHGILGNVREWAWDEDAGRAVTVGWAYDFSGNPRKDPFTRVPIRDSGDRRVGFRCVLIPTGQ